MRKKTAAPDTFKVGQEVIVEGEQVGRRLTITRVDETNRVIEGQFHPDAVGTHITTATRRMEQARKARDERAQEVILLLAWLTKHTKIEAHLTTVDTPNVAMNYIVCLHKEGKRLAWRLNYFEMRAYFKHLTSRNCGERGMSREDKMTFLANFVSRAV